MPDALILSFKSLKIKQKPLWKIAKAVLYKAYYWVLLENILQRKIVRNSVANIHAIVVLLADVIMV